MADIDNPFTDDEVVGVLTKQQADDAATEARSKGFGAEVLCGRGDAEEIEVEGDGALDSVMRFFQQGEEQDALADYHQRLVDGDAVVRIIDVGDRADEASQILTSHGGDTVWHYGEWTYKKMAD